MTRRSWKGRPIATCPIEGSVPKAARRGCSETVINTGVRRETMDKHGANKLLRPAPLGTRLFLRTQTELYVVYVCICTTLHAETNSWEDAQGKKPAVASRDFKLVSTISRNNFVSGVIVSRRRRFPSSLYHPPISHRSRSSEARHPRARRPRRRRESIALVRFIYESPFASFFFFFFFEKTA